MNDELRDKVRKWLLDTGATHIYGESIVLMPDALIDVIIMHALEAWRVGDESFAAQFGQPLVRDM